MRSILLFFFCISLSSVFAQNQTADYNRLSIATKNAYSVPKMEYTYKIEYKSTATGTGSSNPSSSSQKSTVSGDYRSTPAINVNEGRLQKQAEAGARQNARLSAFDAKMNRVDELIASRGLKKTPEYQPQLVQAAIDGGLTAYEASRFFGNSPQEYSAMVASKNRTAGNGAQQETLTFASGNTYTGQTLNSEPHGEGTVTFARTGQVMKGEFKNGQANGMMTITDKNYVQTGRFVDGKPVGDQRYDYDDGKTKMVEIRNMETGKSTVQYPDKTSFDGLSDENGKYVKGKVRYASGISFDGDFKNGNPYRGVWEFNGRVMIGEFEEASGSNMYLKFGYHFDPETKDKTYGSYTPGMKRIGYSRKVSSDNRVQHYIYGENETELYVYVQFPGGNLLSVKASQDGYDYVGTYYEAATNTLDPVIFSKKDGIQVIPAANPLAEKAKVYSREVAPAINAGKQEYETKLKAVEPYINRYNEARASAQVSGKTITTETSNKQQAPDAKSKPTGPDGSVTDGTNNIETRKPANVFFSGWERAAKENWTVLEVPETDQNIHRYLKDGQLKFKTKSDNFTWAWTNLNNAKPESYQYEAVYEIKKAGFNNGMAGILIDIDDIKLTSYGRLFFMCNPGAQTFYLGLYTPSSNQWTSFTSPNQNGGWIHSKAIQTFSEKGIATNKLRLQKVGDEIFLYANDKLVFIHSISASGKPLNKFSGIGIIQGGLLEGSITSIRFN